MSLRHTWINQQPLDAPFDSFVGERRQLTDFFGNELQWVDLAFRHRCEPHAQRHVLCIKSTADGCPISVASSGNVSHLRFANQNVVPCLTDNFFCELDAIDFLVNRPRHLLASYFNLPASAGCVKTLSCCGKAVAVRHWPSRRSGRAASSVSASRRSLQCVYTLVVWMSVWPMMAVRSSSLAPAAASSVASQCRAL